MISADSRSWNIKRPAGVTEAFQVRKHNIEFHADDSSNILANEKSWSKCFNNSMHMRPERAVIRRAASLPGR